jgi:glycosyltransferase involved in cell wall biosynthesis
MKVLHLINGDFYSGAERVADLLALKLPALGYRVDFATLKRGLFAQCRQATDARLFDVSMRSRFDMLVAQKVARLLREGDYQLLHTHTTRSALIGRVAATLARRPMVHHVHSPTARDTQHALRNKLNVAVEGWSLRRASRLITVSSSLREYLRESGYPADKITVAPNGVPVDPQPIDWRMPAGPWVVGAVGLFRPRKGLEILLQALHLCVQQGIDLRLRLVGGFEEEGYRAQTVKLSETLGIANRIEWIGFTRAVRAELGHLHIFVLPSLYGEGLSMALIEAMAAGLPSIASAVEGTTEVLTPAGAGLLVEPGNADQLASAIASLVALGPRARALADAGRMRQIERYSDTTMARSVADIYRHVLSPHANIAKTANAHADMG